MAYCIDCVFLAGSGFMLRCTIFFFKMASKRKHRQKRQQPPQVQQMPISEEIDEENESDIGKSDGGQD